MSGNDVVNRRQSRIDTASFIKIKMGLRLTPAEQRSLGGVIDLAAIGGEAIYARPNSKLSGMDGDHKRINQAETSQSPKMEGMVARTTWLKTLANRGIVLTGQRKKYYSRGGESIGIAFANEVCQPDQPRLRDKWFLGLKDEQTDFVVLLCRDRGGVIFDFVIPGSALASTWNSLSRSGTEVKFNVVREGDEFRLSFPPREFMDITKYLSNYDVFGRVSGQ